MKKISVKKILSVLLALSISLSVPEFTYADTDATASGSQTKDVQVVFTAWDNLNGSTYAYDRLSDTEKALYNKIKERLDYYLRTNADFEGRYSTTLESMVYEDTIYDDTKTLDEVQLRRVLETVDYSKYYFFDGSIAYNSIKQCVYLMYYNDFSDGDYRATVSNALNEKINYYKNTVSASCTNDIDKISKINELICDMTDYDHETYENRNTTKGENPGVYNTFAFSMYAPLTGNKSVCTAYSSLFSILSEKLGFEVISVHGSGHVWNKIKVNDTWYAVDVTMNDNPNNSGGGSRTYALLVKDNVCLNIYDELNGYVPTCEHDYFTEKKEAEEKAAREAAIAAENERLENLLPRPKGLKVKKTKKGKKIVVNKYKLSKTVRKEILDNGEQALVFEFSKTKDFKKIYNVYVYNKNYFYLKDLPKQYRKWKYVRVYFYCKHTYANMPKSNYYDCSTYKYIFSKNSKVLKIK